MDFTFRKNNKQDSEFILSGIEFMKRFKQWLLLKELDWLEHDPAIAPVAFISQHESIGGLQSIFEEERRAELEALVGKTVWNFTGLINKLLSGIKEVLSRLPKGEVDNLQGRIVLALHNGEEPLSIVRDIIAEFKNNAPAVRKSLGEGSGVILTVLNIPDELPAGLDKRNLGHSLRSFI